MSTETEKSAAIKAAEAALAPFLKEHRFSRVDEIEIGNDKSKPPLKRLIIRYPWGDPSLVFLLPSESGSMEPITRILNNVILPERFTAIWHKDRKQLEVIYTAYKISENGRQFLLRYKSVDYVCKFGASSESLLELARAHRPIGESTTSYRNLRSFLIYVTREGSKNKEEFNELPIGTPVSFWIDKIPEWNEEEILEIVRHLNFYMRHFDNKTPQVIVHSPKVEAPEFKDPPQFRVGHFPEKITARSIETNLLHYWEASLVGDSSRRFLYSYRIIEYEAFSHIEAETRSNIRRVLAMPDAVDNVEGTIDEVVNILNTVKQNWESRRLESFLAERIEPRVLWNEICRNPNAFNREFKLDGNFVIPALIKTNWDENVFDGSGVQHFASIVRGIRNALSHGREQSKISVIIPTHSNFARLKPWASLMEVAASEVLIYKGISIVKTKKARKEKENKTDADKEEEC